MKKLFCLLLSLLLLSSAAFAEAVPVDENAELTREEIEMYLDALGRAALKNENTAVLPVEQGGAEVRLNDTVLLISDETLTDSTAFLCAYPGESQADLRGLFIGSSMEQVLAAYPNDNPSLTGTYYDAALFISGEKPEVSMGYLLREGQRVSRVAYHVLSWQPDGVAVSSVSYELKDGYVTSIRIGSADEILEEEAALESIREITEMQEVSEYFAYARSETGEDLAPFTREDLGLIKDGHVKMDFLDMTAEAAVDAFGPAPVDEWTEDSDGSRLRLLQWDGVSLLLKYDAEKRFVSVDSLTVNDDVLDGPRGVRIGDTLDSVIYRFRHGEVFVADDTVALYGDGQETPYGMLAYTPESAELSYAFALDESSAVIWHMTFVAGTLQTMSLLLR